MIRHAKTLIVKTTAVSAALLVSAAGAFLLQRIVSGFDDKDTEGRQTTTKVQHVLPCLPASPSAHPLERVSF